MSDDSIKIGRYQHFKGNIYRVLGTVTHSETLEELVLYHREHSPDKLWVRPREMFSEIVKGPDGQSVSRFSFLE
jgi:hypothetical protein